MHIWVYKNTKGMGFGIGDWWDGIGPGGGRGPGGRRRPTHKTCKYDCRPSRSSSISVLLCTRRVWRHNVSFRMCVYLTDTNCVDIDTSNRPSSGDQCTQLFLLPRLVGIPYITRLRRSGHVECRFNLVQKTGVHRKFDLTYLRNLTTCSTGHFLRTKESSSKLTIYFVNFYFKISNSLYSENKHWN